MPEPFVAGAPVAWGILKSDLALFAAAICHAGMAALLLDELNGAVDAGLEVLDDAGTEEEAVYVDAGVD